MFIGFDEEERFLSKIVVKVNQVKCANEDLKNLVGKLRIIESNLQNLHHWIDYKIKGRDNIGAHLNNAIEAADKLETQLKGLYNFIEDSIDMYQKADKKINDAQLDGAEEESFSEKLGDILDAVWDGVIGFGNGLADGVVSTAEGIWNMVTHPIETLDGLVYSVTHLDETLSAMRDAIVEYWENDVINGDAGSRGNFFGRATVEVLLMVVGTKGVDKVSKLGKAGGKGTKVSTIEKVKEKAVKISRDTTNGVKVAWNKTKEVVGNVRVPVKVNVPSIRTTNGSNIPIGINVETKSVNEIVQKFSVKKVMRR